MAGHLLSKFDNNAVMHDTVNSGCGGQGIFEDLIPLRKNEIGGNHHAAALVAFRQQGEEDFHFVTGLLNVTDIVKDQECEAIQSAQFRLQFQVASGTQATIDEAVGWSKENTATEVDEFVAHGGREMGLPSTGQAEE